MASFELARLTQSEELLPQKAYAFCSWLQHQLDAHMGPLSAGALHA
jgi:hypothetical protein